jgi:uncharacterized repeat protein (TIGR03847 family)
MADSNIIEMRPVSHITTDAIGDPGERVFYMQARNDQRTITVIVEKFQVQTLAVGVEQFLAEVNGKFPDLPSATADYDEDQMRINPPVEPVFRAGQIGLGYDADADLVALELREGIPGQGDEEAQDTADGAIARLWCSRSQIRALVNWGLEVASRGRPMCPQCGQPMDPEGHFCQRKNGHKH